MLVAFFADDASASHAALLVATVLDRRADAAEPGFLAGGERIVDAVPHYLDAAAGAGRDLMVALPLSHLGNRHIRDRLDLAVVTFGPTAWASAAAARALALDGRRTGDGPSPAWVLACRGLKCPAGTRAIPTPMVTPRRRGAMGLLEGRLCPELTDCAVGLAAALRIAAEDPRAPGLDRDRVAAVLTAPGTAGDLALRTELLDLAVDLVGGPVDGRDPVRRSRATESVQRRPPERRDRGQARARQRRTDARRRVVAGTATDTSIIHG